MARILLFDIDMTLIRTNRAGREAIDRAFAELYGVTDATAGVRIDGRTDRGIFLDVIALHGLANEDVDAAFTRSAEAYLRALPGALERRGGSVLPGVAPLLDALSASHPAVGLATGNMERGARAKLGHFGLWERFAAGGFGDDSAVRAEVVRSGIDRLAAILGIDAAAHDTIVIGDTPLDVEAAHHAGVRALAVATGSFPKEDLAASGAEWVVDSLEDPDVLRMLRGG